MKWVSLAIVLAAVYPVSEWLRRNPHQAPKAWALLGLMPFLMTVGHLVMAFISVDGDPLAHYVHGAEFSLLDALAITLFLSSPNRRFSVPFWFVMFLYFLSVAFSALQSIYPMATLFYAWQLLRMFFIYTVVAHGCVDPRVSSAILTGMAAGFLIQPVLAIWQHFGLGIQQATGTFDHQNILGMISHLVVFPFFALFLRGRGGRLAIAVVVSGVIVELLTASRATIGLAAIAYASVFAMSALRGWTRRKVIALSLGAMTLVVLAPVALTMLEVRRGNDAASSDQARNKMENAAEHLISRYPLGVGANTYVIAANMSGANNAAGLDWTSNAIFVHNSYLLIAAETGYPGLISLVVLIICPVIVAFRSSRRERRDARGDLLLGLGVGLLTTYIHAAFEWVFLLGLTQYMLAIEFGMIVGLARQLGYWRRTYASNVPPQIGASNVSKAHPRFIGRPVQMAPTTWKNQIDGSR